MIPRVPFLLDASVFIQAAQRYYAFDLAPGFWEALITHAEKQDLCSIDRVRDELLRGNDDLAEWAREKFRDYFMSTSDYDVLEQYSKIMEWTDQNGQFDRPAKEDFARDDNADAWLVAYAKTKNLYVVTQEVFNPKIRRRIPMERKPAGADDPG